MHRMQEYENSRTHGDSNRQAAQKSVKGEQSRQACLPTKRPLGDMHTDANYDCVQPAQGTSESIPSSKPITGLCRSPCKAAAAAAAGKAKRTTSEAEQALLEPSAKRLRTTQATQTYPHDFLAVRQAIQHDSNEAVEVNGVICIDIEPHAASDPSAEQAQQAQQNAQAVQVHDPKPHAAPKSRGKETQQGRKTAQAVQLRASKPHVASKPRGKQAQQEQNEAQAVQVHGRKPHAASELSDKQAQAQAVQAHGPKPRAGKGPKRKKAQQPRHGVEAMQMDGPKPPAASEASGKQAQQGPQKAQAARVKVPKPRAASRAKGKQAQVQAKPCAGAGPRRKQAQRARQEAQAVPANGPGHEDPAQQARRLGNHFGARPHRLIIGGENPSKWREGCVPQPAYSRQSLPAWVILALGNTCLLSETCEIHVCRDQKLQICCCITYPLMACRRPGPRPYGHPGNRFWRTAKEARIVTADLADEKEVLLTFPSLPNMPVVHHVPSQLESMVDAKGACTIASSQCECHTTCPLTDKTWLVRSPCTH